MNARISAFRFSLPLLAKELLEQAARRRTYIIRVAYALLLFAGAYALFSEILFTSTGNVWSLMGKGRELYERLLGLQFFGIYLFMPAITCGVLTQEKERDSLMLLLLTRLDPWTIVVEKLLSRLVPMTCFLAMSLPLLALAYSLGGITPGFFWSGIWMLFITAVQVGTLAVTCSAWFRTTVGAFLATYILGFLLIFGPALGYVLIEAVVSHGNEGRNTLFNSPMVQFLQQIGVIDHPEQLMFPFFAPVQILSPNVWGKSPNYWMTSLRTVPILLWCWGFMYLANRFVVSRAFVGPFNPLLAFLRKIDGLFQRLNQNRLTRGVVLVADKSRLPEERPIAWRETTKRSFGRTRYLARLFLVLESLVLALLFLNAIISGDVYLPAPAITSVLAWLLLALLVTVASASLFSGERTHQTLDVLCVTPYSSSEIIRQKFTGVSRLILVLSAPLLTIIVFETFWRGQFWGHDEPWSSSRVDPPLFFVSSLLTLLIYPRAIAWLTCLIGLVTRTQVRAIMTSLIVIVGWCAAPWLFLLAPMIAVNPNIERTPLIFLNLLSPVSMLVYTQNDMVHQYFGSPWTAVALNTVFMGSVWLACRTVCLTRAARLLGRSETFNETPPQSSDMANPSPPRDSTTPVIQSA